METSDSERQQVGRKHVFVVNGSATFLDFARALLESENYNVTTTNYVPRTFDQIAALQPDLLIIDLVVGVQAGWDLLSHLQKEAGTNEIPIIVASTDEDLLNRARTEQADYADQRYIMKPLDIDDLLGAIRTLIGGAEPDDRPR